MNPGSSSLTFTLIFSWYSSKNFKGSSEVNSSMILPSSQIWISLLNILITVEAGSPIREYIFAKDAARGMILALEKYCKADPINLSSGESVTINDLAKKILDICNYDPKITFDKSKPGGQSRRVLTNHKATNSWF